MNKKIFFITGTNTNIGKTNFCLNILFKSYINGFINFCYKPLSLGIKNDFKLLKKKINFKVNIKKINMFFNFLTSPNIVIIKENRLFLFKNLNLKFIMKNNLLIIEGVGGLFTPLSKSKTYIKLIKKKNIPILIIIFIKIGCINHSLLTINLIKSNNLLFSGWYVNEIIKKNEYYKDYLNSLKVLLPTPFLGKIKKFDNFKNYLNNFIVPK